MLVTLDDFRTMTYYWPPPHKIQFWIVYSGAVPPYGGAAFFHVPSGSNNIQRICRRCGTRF